MDTTLSSAFGQCAGQIYADTHEAIACTNHPGSTGESGQRSVGNQSSLAALKHPGQPGTAMSHYIGIIHPYLAHDGTTSASADDGGHRNGCEFGRRAPVEKSDCAAAILTPVSKCTALAAQSDTIPRKGKRMASTAVTPKAVTRSSTDLSPAVVACEGVGDDDAAQDVPVNRADAPIIVNPAAASDITKELVRQQRLRQMNIRQVQQINLPIKAMCRQAVDFSTYEKAKEAKIKLKRAQNIFGYLAEGKPATLPPEDMEHALYLAEDVTQAKAWIVWLEKRRASIERTMVNLAKRLPAASFVASTPGLSLKALAIVQAEARGDIETFYTVSRLIKRLGWAADKGYAQKDCSKVRKAALFAAIAEPVLRTQSVRYAKDADGKETTEVTRGAGRDRLVYDRARAKYDAINEAGGYAERAAAELAKNHGASAASKALWRAGKLTGGHLHARALRVMLKCILIDIYRVARGQAPKYGVQEAADGTGI